MRENTDLRKTSRLLTSQVETHTQMTFSSEVVHEQMTCAISSYKEKTYGPLRQQECSQHSIYDNSFITLRNNS